VLGDDAVGTPPGERGELVAAVAGGRVDQGDDPLPLELRRQGAGLRSQLVVEALNAKYRAIRTALGQGA